MHPNGAMNSRTVLINVSRKLQGPRWAKSIFFTFLISKINIVYFSFYTVFYLFQIFSL